MRELTIKEFANATGQKDGTVRQHLNRGLLQKTENGYIDVDDEMVKRYIHDKTNGAGLYGAVVKEVPVKVSKSKEEIKKASKVLSDHEKEIIELDMQKRRNDAALKERQAELARFELERKAGNSLPLDLVEKILVINIQSVYKNIELENDNIAAITNDKFGGTRKDLAEIKQMQREILSKAIEKAKQDAAFEIETAVQEWSEMRGIGQKR